MSTQEYVLSWEKIIVVRFKLEFLTTEEMNAYYLTSMEMLIIWSDC